MSKNLIKFRDNMQTDVVKNLFEDDSIVKDVKESFNVKLGRNAADDIHKQTIEHFNRLVKEQTDNHFAKLDLHTNFAELKKMKHGKPSALGGITSLTPKQYSYVSCEPVIVDYKKKLKKAHKEFKAELQNELEQYVKLTKDLNIPN